MILHWRVHLLGLFVTIFAFKFFLVLLEDVLLHSAVFQGLNLDQAASLVASCTAVPLLLAQLLLPA